MDRQIICGEIEETLTGTPIEIFKKAVKLSKIENFRIKTNNPQFIEALEVLCGEENIRYFIYMNNEYCEQERAMDIYNYLGDVYDIINSLRFQRDLADEFDDSFTFDDDKIQEEIDEYEIKHQYHAEELHQIDESKFKEYEEIQEPPKHIKAYKTDKPVVFRNKWGIKRVANVGDWIVQYNDGDLTIGSDSILHNYKETTQ